MELDYAEAFLCEWAGFISHVALISGIPLLLITSKEEQNQLKRTDVGVLNQIVTIQLHQNLTMASEECILLGVELDDFILCNSSAIPHANLSYVNEDFFYYRFLYAIPTIYGIIILIGLVGNITLIKIFCTVKSMRNVPNLFISSLAIGDLLLLLTCVPVDASRYLSPEWLFGRVGCKLIPFIQLTSVGVSVFTLMALSADR